ncbi:MAG: hypothetical protein ACRCXZ_01430 [Patescibacteria group bacterium]
MEFSKRVAILGIGGHGLVPLSKTLDAQHVEFHIVTPPADFGGFTGKICRAVEEKNHSLNKHLHGFKLPNLPFGDFNKIIGFFVGKHNPKCEDQYLQRCSSIDSILKNFELFAKCFELDSECVESFASYIHKVFHFCNSHGLDIEGGSLAHYFNAWVYYNSGSMKEFNSFYQRYQILPPNVNLWFLVEERLVLQGSDCNGTLLKGEDVIDVHNLPINPPSLTLVNIDGSTVTIDQLLPTYEIIKDCDLAILPNGSVANYLPVVNESQLYQPLLRKWADNDCLLVMTNLFHTNNENPFNAIVNLLNIYSIPAIYLGPKMRSYMRDMEMIKNYEDEDKYANDLTMVMDAGGYFARFELVRTKRDGLKYEPSSVAKTVLLFINRILYP